MIEITTKTEHKSEFRRMQELTQTHAQKERVVTCSTVEKESQEN